MDKNNDEQNKTGNRRQKRVVTISSGWAFRGLKFHLFIFTSYVNIEMRQQISQPTSAKIDLPKICTCICVVLCIRHLISASNSNIPFKLKNQNPIILWHFCPQAVSLPLVTKEIIRKICYSLNYEEKQSS